MHSSNISKIQIQNHGSNCTKVKVIIFPGWSWQGCWWPFLGPVHLQPMVSTHWIGGRLGVTQRFARKMTCFHYLFSRSSAIGSLFFWHKRKIVESYFSDPCSNNIFISLKNGAHESQGIRAGLYTINGTSSGFPFFHQKGTVDQVWIWRALS